MKAIWNIQLILMVIITKYKKLCKHTAISNERQRKYGKATVISTRMSKRRLKKLISKLETPPLKVTFTFSFFQQIYQPPPPPTVSPWPRILATCLLSYLRISSSLSINLSMLSFSSLNSFVKLAILAKILWKFPNWICCGVWQLQASTGL